MDTVKQWAVIVVIATLIACIFDMLTPNGRMKKTFKVILCVFLLCGVFVPLVNVITGMPLKLDKLQSTSIPSELKSGVTSEFSNQASSQIEKLAGDLLNKNNLEYKKIDVSMDIDENFSISIIRITVIIDKSRLIDESLIKNILEENLNIQTEVKAL